VRWKPTKKIFHWRNGEGVNGDVSDIANEKAESLAEKFERVANLLVERIPGFIDKEKTTLSMVATAAGISIDKARLLRNQPTAIGTNCSLTLTDEERRARIIELFLTKQESDTIGLTLDLVRHFLRPVY